MMLLAHVMRRAGTFTMEEKVKMLEFIGIMAQNPDQKVSLMYAPKLQSCEYRYLTG